MTKRTNLQEKCLAGHGRWVMRFRIFDDLENLSRDRIEYELCYYPAT